MILHQVQPPLQLAAAVTLHFASTVILAFVNDPTLEFTVDKVDVFEPEGTETSPVIAALDATTLPVVGVMTRVPSLLFTLSIAPVPASMASWIG